MKASARYAASVLLLCAAGLPGLPEPRAKAEEGIAQPGPDETLIYVIRLKKYSGGFWTYWVALNDQTVARLDDKRYATVRAKAGLNTLNLAAHGFLLAAAAVDDRPGQTVYLRYEGGETNMSEINEAEARGYLKKYKKMAPLDEPRPNNEEMRTLMNLSRLGLDLTKASKPGLQPTDDDAVVTLFTRDSKYQDKIPVKVSVWSQSGYVAGLGNAQAVELRVPAGEHFFFAALTSTGVARAHIEAGKRYYAWVELGKVGTAKIRLVDSGDARSLKKWLRDVSYVELNANAVTKRVGEREQEVLRHFQEVADEVRSGELEVPTISAEHAFAK